MGESWRQAIDGRHSDSLACMDILYKCEIGLGNTGRNIERDTSYQVDSAADCSRQTSREWHGLLKTCISA